MENIYGKKMTDFDTSLMTVKCTEYYAAMVVLFLCKNNHCMSAYWSPKGEPQVMIKEIKRTRSFIDIMKKDPDKVKCPKCGGKLICFLDDKEFSDDR